ncbi:hypothetical protein [Bythopirellula polymerisocia]|uniref:Uncharacterized protein n=1 Tax=Bythopirellula polymerisocia TaxID=2528003 RepID=A0A5C6CX63_9BACT|nr:hypothetical protein [Bythopirellula polymerisocia]TWU28465.1 hypothetical protein Pla144_17550 [Bythopirellula polymerisocia]
MKGDAKDKVTLSQRTAESFDAGRHGALMLSVQPVNVLSRASTHHFSLCPMRLSDELSAATVSFWRGHLAHFGQLLCRLVGPTPASCAVAKLAEVASEI